MAQFLLNSIERSGGNFVIPTMRGHLLISARVIARGRLLYANARIAASAGYEATPCVREKRSRARDERFHQPIDISEESRGAYGGAGA